MILHIDNFLIFNVQYANFTQNPYAPTQVDEKFMQYDSYAG